MEVVCKAVCGLGEASAPKFRHDVSPFFLQRALPSALLPRGSSPWNPSCKQKYFCLRFDFSDFFCNIRNTPIKSDRSIFLSFVFLIIYLIFLPSLRPPQKRMLLQTGCRGLSPAGVLGWNPKVLRFLFVFVVLHHHRTNLHGQTEQVDEPVCVLVVVKLTCCKGSDGFVI